MGDESESESESDFEINNIDISHYIGYPKVENLVNSLSKREISSYSRRLSNVLPARVIDDLVEQPIKGIEQFDKIFTSAWLDNENVVVGTKCNQFCIWNRNTLQWRKIPLPIGDPTQQVQDNCGIHSIALSQSSNLLAVGGGKPSEVVLFDVPSFKPKHVFTGHQDWVFGIQFIDEETIVTCGREGWINLYSTRLGESVFVKKQLITRPAHELKVRDIKYHAPNETLASVSADERVKFWDIGNLDEISSVQLLDTNDVVTLAFHGSGNILAVGSNQYITLIDPRCHKIFSMISVDEPGCGIRSINFQRDVMSVGSGRGGLSFFDIRTQSPMILTKTKQNYHTTSKGWLSRDGNFRSIFGTEENPDYNAAVYTHQYDPIGSQLFVAGGPLLLGLKGSYAALWS